MSESVAVTVPTLVPPMASSGTVYGPEACITGARLGRDRAAVRATKDEERAAQEAATIRVSSGGDGPKVEVVSRRSTAHLEPEAAAAPVLDKKE